MSESTRCDGCGKVAARAPFSSIRVWYPTGGWLAVQDSHGHRYDVCSVECLGLFAALLEASVEAVQATAVVKLSALPAPRTPRPKKPTAS